MLILESMSQNLYEGTIGFLIAGSMDIIVLLFNLEQVLKSEIICKECGKALKSFYLMFI